MRVAVARLLALILAAFLSPAQPCAADVAVPVALPSAAQILAANAAARGGIAAWRSVKTLVERGLIEHGGAKTPGGRMPVAGGGARAYMGTLPFTLMFKRPHEMRVEMDLGDLRALQLFDGKQGWTLQPSPRGPVVHAYTPAESAAFAEQSDPEGPLLDAAAKGTRVTLLGVEPVEGHRAYKLELTLQDGAKRHVWVDATTFLDLKIDGTRLVGGRAWPMETYFYDWRSAGALKLPGRIETAIDGVRTSTRLIVQSVFVNRPIDEAMFRLDPAQAAH